MKKIKTVMEVLANPPKLFKKRIIDGIDYRDIDDIKSRCSMIHAFGLGFIQIKLDYEHRIHLYSSAVKITSGEEDFHNHRYNFESFICQGNLTNEIIEYRVAKPGTHLHSSASGELDKGECVITPAPFTVDIANKSSFSMCAGSSYKLNSEVFHRVAAAENTITLLKRGLKLKSLAAILFPFDKEKECPFSANVHSEDKLWEIYREAINA